MDIAITTTREFFRSISKNFISWSINKPALIILLIILVLILIAIGVYVSLNRLAQKRAKKDVFTVTEPSIILSILKQALEERGTFQVFFNPESSYSLKCSIKEVKDDTLILELPGYIKSLKQKIIGKKVYIIFGVPYKKQRVFYFFSSHIKAFFKENNFLFIVVSFPSVLELRQKRNFLRIEVATDDFIDLIVWKEKFLSSGALVNKPMELGIPIYKKREKSFFPVMDISGLGIRLKFSKNYLKAFVEKDLEKGDGFIIFLRIKDERRNKVYSMFLHGIIKNVFKDPVEKYVEYGVQFIDLGKYNEDKKIIEWIKVDPKFGIRELADWVMQKHLYYFRKGIV